MSTLLEGGWARRGGGREREERKKERNKSEGDDEGGGTVRTRKKKGFFLSSLNKKNVFLSFLFFFPFRDSFFSLLVQNCHVPNDALHEEIVNTMNINQHHEHQQTPGTPLTTISGGRRRPRAGRSSCKLPRSGLFFSLSSSSSSPPPAPDVGPRGVSRGTRAGPEISVIILCCLALRVFYSFFLLEKKE